MKVVLHVRLVVRAVAGASAPDRVPLLDHLDAVYANLVDQEAANDALLDSDMDVEVVDGPRAVADVRLTLETVDVATARSVGVSSLRAAVHAAGIHTPHWDDVPHEGVVRTLPLEATEEVVEATPLVDA